MRLKQKNYIMTTFKTKDNGVYIQEENFHKFIPFADVVKFSAHVFDTKFIVRVARKDGLYMLYTDDRAEQKEFMQILEHGCGRREE
jgi:hypothetical protein